MNISTPLFCDISENDQKAIIMAKHIGQKVSIAVGTILANDATEVPNVASAEKIILDIARTGNPIELGSSLTHGIMLMRAANLIASRTRLSYGNRIFMHPSDLELLTEMESTDAERYGDWNYHGTLCTSEVFTSEKINRGEAIVALIAPMSSPAFLFKHGTKLSVALFPSREDIIGDYSSFVSRVCW